MKIKDLFSGIPGVKIWGTGNISLTGISSDSRRTSPGNLFLARRGKAYQGGDFISQALDQGAVAILSDLYNPFLECTQVIVPDPGKLEAFLAAKIYGEPSKHLYNVGVTGSKGKTTTAALCRHFLNGFGYQCGLIGTIEIDTGKEQIDSSLTTPGAIEVQKHLRQMIQSGCDGSVIEVSSHALDQNRVGEIEFDVGIFTNLYPDHLDYHQSMESYALAKRKLFQNAKNCLINIDSPWADFMSKGNRMTFGIEKKADIQIERISGDRFFIEGISFRSPLLGTFNLYNILAAISLGAKLGKSLKEMSSLLETFPGVPGRLQKVSSNIFVDFAHTGESLAQALITLRGLTRKRLIVVFGAGGDREIQRRLEMGKAADQHADLSIITTDNPRSEDPIKIAREIAAVYSGQPEIIIDRKEAIFRAIEIATSEDIVLIAGRGHEKIQIFSGKNVSFDDVLIAKEASCV